ncbi:MAG: hypothetical protein V2A34_07190 [Lentisphaerota bacterium]
MALIACMMPGCVVKRGVDFGHWAGKPQNIPLVRVYDVDESKSITPDASILLLPPVNDMPDTNKEQFQSVLYKQLRNYFPPNIAQVDTTGPLSEYVRQDNLMPTLGLFDFAEAARIGQLLGVSNVLCVWVRDFRLHPHQLLALSMAMVDSASGKAIGRLDASFDASEQQVILAVADYLESRTSRPYDKVQLELMLRSPYEYSMFACDAACRKFAEHLVKK